MGPLSVHIIYNKTNTYGLQEDARMIDHILQNVSTPLGCTIGHSKHVDMREPLSHCDIQFHLEIPVFSAIPWAHTNILLVNPEQWSFAYDDYVHAFDALLFRDPFSAEQFREELEKKGLRHDHIHIARMVPMVPMVRIVTVVRLISGLFPSWPVQRASSST